MSLARAIQFAPDQSAGESRPVSKSADGLQALLDLLVRDVCQFLERTSAVYRNRQDRRGIEVQALDDRRICIARQLSNDGGNFVADFLSGDVGILVEHELHDNQRHAFEGCRAKLVDTADGVDHFLDGGGRHHAHQRAVALCGSMLGARQLFDR